jgi:hypothetical protein
MVKVKVCHISFLLLVSFSIVNAQTDDIIYFSQDDLMEVKDWRGIGYFLIGDSSVMKLVSCRNEGEVCKYSFYQIKFDKTDSTLHIIGDGRDNQTGKFFKVFNIYIGQIEDNKYLLSSSKFKNLKYSVFDITFKFKPDERLFVNIGYSSETEKIILMYTMDSFNINELIYTESK